MSSERSVLESRSARQALLVLESRSARQALLVMLARASKARSFFPAGFVGIAGLLLFLGAFSCNRAPQGAEDPKRLLSDYISRSFSVKRTQDRDELLTFLTGEAKTRLAAWSEDQFLQAFVDSKRQFIKLVFSEVKAKSPQEMDITYELTYLDQGKGHDAKVTNKKLCELVNERGKWLIREVRNIKELVEYRNEMALP